MIVYTVYSCYSDSYEDPAVFFEVCETKEKANEIFKGFRDNVILQLNDLDENIEEDFSVDEDKNLYVVRELDGSRLWEVYIIEKELL